MKDRRDLLAERDEQEAGCPVNISLQSESVLSFELLNENAIAFESCFEAEERRMSDSLDPPDLKWVDSPECSAPVSRNGSVHLANDDVVDTPVLVFSAEPEMDAVSAVSPLCVEEAPIEAAPAGDAVVVAGPAPIEAAPAGDAVVVAGPAPAPANALARNAGRGGRVVGGGGGGRFRVNFIGLRGQEPGDMELSYVHLLSAVIYIFAFVFSLLVVPVLVGRFAVSSYFAMDFSKSSFKEEVGDDL
jgi:hypothetical protein